MKERMILIADEGKLLTDGENYGKAVFLADGVSADKYAEITDAEYQKLMKDRDSME